MTGTLKGGLGLFELLHTAPEAGVDDDEGKMDACPLRTGASGCRWCTSGAAHGTLL
jgi:hypothetical protein